MAGVYNCEIDKIFSYREKKGIQYYLYFKLTDQPTNLKISKKKFISCKLIEVPEID